MAQFVAVLEKFGEERSRRIRVVAASAAAAWEAALSHRLVAVAGWQVVDIEEG